MVNLFRDFALMMESQGELLDQIEYQVSEAKEHVENSNVLLNDAVRIERSTRLCQARIVCIVIVIIVIVAVFATIGEEIKIHES